VKTKRCRSLFALVRNETIAIKVIDPGCVEVMKVHKLRRCCKLQHQKDCDEQSIVETRSLLQAVKRNSERFPSDFMFQLTRKESDSLRSRSVITKGRGGRRYLPYVFTEHGAIMAANVLNSKTAVRARKQ